MWGASVRSPGGGRDEAEARRSVSHESPEVSANKREIRRPWAEPALMTSYRTGEEEKSSLSWHPQDKGTGPGAPSAPLLMGTHSPLGASNRWAAPSTQCPSWALNHLTWSLLPIVFITIDYATRLNSMRGNKF